MLTMAFFQQVDDTLLLFINFLIADFSGQRYFYHKAADEAFQNCLLFCRL